MLTPSSTRKTPSFRPATLLLVGLSLSIGWGIRGNFGHEYGAAFAGCLAALTVCLLSGRQDWRERVLYFGFFGALGWGFGGSMSYMQVISYTESGHFSSQWYGYTCLFVIGFLWAALGGAGTALAAVADRRSLELLFRPILFVFAAWYLLDLIEDPVSSYLQSQIQFDHTWSRHKSPLYWFDADYLAAFFALLGVGIYDLTNRKEKNLLFLPLIAAVGALAGWGIQVSLAGVSLWEQFLSALTYKLGDVNYKDPVTGALAFDPDNFLTNWPQWFGDYEQHVGWVIGLVAGITFYFIRFGKFRNGSSLIVYMAGGWLLSFLAFPVLGSLFFTGIGGLRMTPPRGDDWAGILGVFLGTFLWMRKNNYLPVTSAMLISGTIGGMGFSGIQWVKQLMMAPGNPRILIEKGLLPDSPEFQATVASWTNWQQQNWHSFLEQSYGFVNGIAIAVALGLLASRLPSCPGFDEIIVKSKDRKWTLGFAGFFVLIAVPYVNLFKNVEEWSSQLNPEVWLRTIKLADGSEDTVPALWDLPYLGRLPGVDYLNLTPEGWFRLSWLLLVVVYVIVVRRHFKSPLAFLNTSWLGKGQLLFLMLLWLMVMGNFERALVGWGPSRLLTEWGIYVNALIVTLLVLLTPNENESIPEGAKVDSFDSLFKKSWQVLVIVVVVFPAILLMTNRMVYHYPTYEKLDKKGYHTRFGVEAGWRAKPILKSEQHK